jgi:hypothetical protein
MVSTPILKNGFRGLIFPKPEQSVNPVNILHPVKTTQELKIAVKCLCIFLQSVSLIK